MKYFRMSWEEILWKRSWANVLMLAAAVPKYKSDEEKKKKVEVIEVEDLSQLEKLLNEGK